MNPGHVLQVIVGSFVGLMIVLAVGPEIETAVAGYTGTNSLVLTLLDVAVWVIPVGGLVAIFYMAFRQIGGSR